jgi:hypothetical protein
MVSGTAAVGGLEVAAQGGGGIRREGDEAVAVARGGVLPEGMGRPRTTDYSTTDQGGGKSEIRNKFKLAEKGKMSKTGGGGKG